MRRAEWREAEQKKRGVKADLIRTKLQCSLCSTLLYSAQPRRILNCLSAVSDLKEVGLFKSLTSHCLSAFHSAFSYFEEQVPCFVLKGPTSFRVFFCKFVLPDKIVQKQMKSRRGMERNLMAFPDTGKVLSH